MALTVTRVRPGVGDGGYDEQGNPLPGTVTTEPVAVRAFAPGVSEEVAAAFGTSVTDAGTVYADAGTDIRPSDRLVIAGETWQVEGHAKDWVSPYGGTTGVEVVVRRAS